MPTWFDEFSQNLGAFLPNLLIALVILIVGWLVAYLLSKLVENLLHRTNLDDRVANSLQGGTPERIPIERWIALAVFWLVMLFVIVMVLTRLDLGAISTPLNNLLQQFVDFLPNLVGALLLIALAWVIATVLRAIIVRVVGASGLTRRISRTAEMETTEVRQRSIGETIGNVVYWLVFLLFLPAILDALELQGLLAPVAGMVNGILGFLPNLLGAALVLVVGYLVARIVRQIVTNLLSSAGVDRFSPGREAAPIPATGTAEATYEGERRPAMGGTRLSTLIGTIVFVLILIPVVIAALNVLNIPAVSQPAAEMLTNFLNALPNIFAAFLLLGIAFYLARIVGNFVAGLLANVGFNGWFSFLGVRETGIRRPVRRATDEAARAATTPDVEPGRTTPSEVVGYIVTAAIMLFAAMEAANLLGFGILATMIGAFITQAVNILFGLIIFGIGLFLANRAARVIRGMNMEQSNVLASAAQIAIIIFSAALALREMGIAASIVNLAFGLMLGAVAVAVAIAFGLGGRDAARQIVNEWQREGLPIPTTGQTTPPEDQGPTGMGSTDTGPTDLGPRDLGPGTGPTGFTDSPSDDEPLNLP